jgi:GT2 family glycosyltransferase
VSVTAVVLSWNGREDTLACLASLEAEPVTPLVVDNGSSDGSVEAVRERGVEVVENGRNLGFAGGMNVGIRLALERGAAHVLTLNNDVEVEPGFLAPLLAAGDVACPQILFGDGRTVWYAGARWDPRAGYHGRNTGYGVPPVAGSPYETDRACGGALLASREAWERVGLFDESLFAYAEDTDWSLRARALGYRIRVVPASVVRHKVSASSGGEGSPTSIYFTLRNSLRVAERHAPLGRVGTARRRAVAVGAHALQALLSRRRLAGLRAVLRAVRDL